MRESIDMKKKNVKGNQISINQIFRMPKQEIKIKLFLYNFNWFYN